MFTDHAKWWIPLILAIIAIIILIPDNLYYTIKEHLNRYQAEDISRQFLSNNNVDLTDYHPLVIRRTDYNTVSYLNISLGMDELKKLLDKDIIPNNKWDIWFRKNLPSDQPQTTHHIWISPQGKIIGYQRLLPDTLSLPSIIEGRALAMARYYIDNHTSIDLENFVMKKSQQSRQLNRTDYEFVWEKKAEFADGIFRLTSNIQGNEIGGYNYSFDIPERIHTIIRSKTTQGTMYFFIQVFVLMAVFVYALVLFLRKYHEGEISVSLGRNLFIIIFGLGLISSINGFPVMGAGVTFGTLSFRNTQFVAFFYEILIRNSFLGVLLLTGWAVGEAYARRFWPDKLNSIDSVLNKKFFTLSTGMALLRGGAIGFILAALYLGFLNAITGKGSDITTISLPATDSFQHMLPFLTISISAIITALVGEVIFRFFIINIVYNRWAKKWLAIVVSALCWAGVAFIFSQFPQISNYYLGFFVTLLIGILLAWLYFKYDLLTLIAANASSQLIFISIPLFASVSSWHQISLILLIFLILLPILLIIMCFIRKDSFQFSYSGLPNHIVRISERERMQKELEIARNVQMGLLPKTNPIIAGFDIAGKCIPAKEVGGDYYDYVELSPNKLGIAIGDVSGKGVPAAIYMTLTKGILQSHADDNVSPKLVLNKVNRLLYRNIEKNSFVSMFYAILDIEKSTLTFARAGHNPGIMINLQDGSNEFLSTDGIALGLEEGNVFDKTLQEQTISISQGNTLVFYTDGFTEAMNAKQEEFGEDTFLQIISDNHHLSADSLIQKLLDNVQRFVGTHPQHDDMTIVVIKSK